MKRNKICLIGIFILLIISCKKDNDNNESETVDYGFFDLLGSSVQRFPYDGSKTEFIYIDSSGNEIKAITKPISYGATTSGHLMQYKTSTDKFFLKYHTQNLSTRLNLLNFERDINIDADVSVDARDYELIKFADVLTVWEFNNSGLVNSERIIINKRTRSENFIESAPYQDSIELNGKKFTQVYIIGEGNNSIYFNFNQGIVGFKDWENGVIYHLK